MKPEILILLERKYSYAEIKKLFPAYPKGMVYRYGRLYRKACEKINIAKLENV